MGLHYATLRSNPEEKEMVELATVILIEELGLDEDAFRVYLADSVVSRKNGEPLAGVVSGTLESGLSVRLKAGRQPRQLFLTLCHELKHVAQALDRRFRKLPDSVHERDSKLYAFDWDKMRLPKNATSYRQIIDYLKKVDHQIWLKAKEHAREWAAEQGLRYGRDRAKLVEYATQQFAPRAHAGREYIITRHGIEYR